MAEQETRRQRLRRWLQGASAIWSRTTYRVTMRWRAVRVSLLDVAGLGLLAWAAGMLAAPAGVAAAGLGCLVMSWRWAGQ